MLEAFAPRADVGGFPFPDLLEKYFPTVEAEPEDFYEEDIPDEDEV